MGKTNSILPGTGVTTWDGSTGTVLALVNGWYRLRMADGLVAEWQGWQLEAAS